MNVLKIKVCGPRQSGKTTIMKHIQKMLRDKDIKFETQICEDVDTENIEVCVSKHDLNHLLKSSNE